MNQCMQGHQVMEQKKSKFKSDSTCSSNVVVEMTVPDCKYV